MELLRIGLAQINAIVGDLEGNANRIIEGIERATFGRSALDRKNGEAIVRCIRKCGSRGVAQREVTKQEANNGNGDGTGYTLILQHEGAQAPADHPVQ